MVTGVTFVTYTMMGYKMSIDNRETMLAGRECIRIKLTGTNQKGVREESYFKIPVARVIWPILHTLIGIGNQILKSFVDIVHNDIEIKSPKEIWLREQLGDLDEKIYNALEDSETWDNASDFRNGKLRNFRKDRNEIKREIEQYNDFWYHEKC